MFGPDMQPPASRASGSCGWPPSILSQYPPHHPSVPCPVCNASRQDAAISCTCCTGYQWNVSFCSSHQRCPDSPWHPPCRCLIFRHSEPSYCQLLPPGEPGRELENHNVQGMCVEKQTRVLPSPSLIARPVPGLLCGREKASPPSRGCGNPRENLDKGRWC